MIYSPRVKLQSLRKEYKISQLELVMEKISRSHLAMIETGKTKLSKKIAKILVENFNEILKQRDIEDRIDLNYLLEDEQSQIDKKRNYYLEDLNKGSLSEELINEIETFIKVADLKSKVLLYTKIADLYYTAGHFKKSYTYYQRSFDDLLIYDDILLIEKVITKFTTINLKFEDYNLNITCGRLLGDKLEKFSKKYYITVLNNLIKSAMELDSFQICLKYLENLEKISENKEELYIIEGKKAESYIGLKLYSEAVSIFRGMLLKYNNPQKKLEVSISLMNAYQLQGNRKKVEAYFRKNFALLKKVSINKIEAPILTKINYDVAQSALFLNKKDKALDFFMRVINSKVEKILKYHLLAMENILDLAEKIDLEFIKRMEEIYFNSLTEKKNFKLGYLYLAYYRKFSFITEESKFLTKQLLHL